MVVASALTVLTFVFGAVAHGGILEYTVDGKRYNGFSPFNTPDGQSSIQRSWHNYDPLLDVTMPTVACNDGSVNAGQLTAPIAAGKEVVAFWNQWPHPTGPLVAYLGNCGTSCDSANPNELDWFKVAEAGLLSGTIGGGAWAAAEMVAKNSSWPVTIPATVPAGEYLLRIETISLHSPPAQVYVQCMQLSVSNTGAAVEPPASILVKFPGAYTQTDPGIAVVIYSQEAQTSTTYVIPGPPLYPGDGSAPQPGPGNSTSTSTSPGTTSTAPPSETTSTAQTSTTYVPEVPTNGTTTAAPEPPTTAAPSPPSTTDGPAASKYGQCGGINFKGPTACVQGSVCTVVNPYYSQCL